LTEPVELEIRLRAGTGGGYIAEMRAWLNEDTDRPFEPYPVQIPLAVLRTLLDNETAYGKALSAAFFENSKVLAAYSFVRARVKARAGLRVRLWVADDAPELHQVRWELLCEPEKDFPLTTNENVYFSRYLPPSSDSHPPGPKPPRGLRALAAVGAPRGLERYKLAAVDAESELRQAGEALAGMKVQNLPASADRCTLNRLVDQLRSAAGGGYDVLYLACHGVYVDGEPYLLLENDDGEPDRASGRELAEKINGLSSRPRLVVLASCQSAGSAAGTALAALGPRLVQAGIPAVIAMQGSVRMDTAALFISAFFRDLNRHGLIDRAAAAARAAVRRQNDWWAPVLFMCLRSGRLWRKKGGADAVIAKPAVAALIPNQIPPTRANFTGRAAELAGLARWVKQGERTINIYGIDGLGKTTLALELIHREAARFPDGILYINMLGRGDRTPVTAEEALAHVIQSYHPSASLPKDPARLEEQYLRVLEGKRALIMLDNVGDEAQIEPLVPPPAGSLALVTSWRGMVGLDGAQRLPLGKMSREDAVDMLLRLAPRAGDDAALLVEKCDYLPLVIASVARLLQAPNLTADEIIDLLENAATELDQDRVDAALKVSYDKLSEVQQLNWRRLAVFAGDFSAEAAAWLFGLITPATPRERMRTNTNLAQWRLSDLLNFGLVEFEADRDRYGLLNAARRFAISLLEPDSVEQAAAHLSHARCFLNLLERAGQMYEQGGTQMSAALALYDQEQRELRAAWGWLNEPGTSAERLALRARYPAAAVDLMVLRMTPSEGLAWLSAGLAAARQLGETGLEITMLGGQGSLHFARHDYEQARSCYQAQLALARQAANCPGLVAALGNLGAVYRAQGRTGQALRYFGRQLALAQRFGDQRQEASALGSMGRTYAALKQLDLALDCYEKDLVLSRQTGDRRGEAIALGGLGNVYRMQQDYPRARQVLEADLAITREIGDQHGAALASWLMGLVYADMGEPLRAADWMQVLVDYERSIDESSARRRSVKVEAMRNRQP
jgi:tetratricopeptide (TPR) repeat protein